MALHSLYISIESSLDNIMNLLHTSYRLMFVSVLQHQYQAMGLFDSFEEDTPHSPSTIAPTVNVEELFDDPKC